MGFYFVSVYDMTSVLHTDQVIKSVVLNHEYMTIGFKSSYR